MSALVTCEAVSMFAAAVVAVAVLALHASVAILLAEPVVECESLGSAVQGAFLTLHHKL